MTLTAITAPALVVALSPIPTVIALILLIHNSRPRASSIAYLLGRLAALAALTLASYIIPRPSDMLHRPLPHWTHWLTAATGAAIMVAGFVALRRRRPATPTPGWHSQVGGIPPAASAALGLLPALVNPKVVAASIAANAQIRTMPSTFGAAAALICYLLVATSTVTAPIGAYMILGNRIDPKLEGLRNWIQRHQNTAAATTLIVIGATIILYTLF